MPHASVTGPAEDFCLVVTQRRHVDDTDLTVTGEIARDWMTKAQAFAGGATGPPPSTTPCRPPRRPTDGFRHAGRGRPSPARGSRMACCPPQPEQRRPALGRLHRAALARAVRAQRRPDAAADHRRGTQGSRRVAGPRSPPTRSVSAGQRPRSSWQAASGRSNASSSRSSAAKRSGASCSASPTRAPTWPASAPAPFATATSTSSTARRSGRAARTTRSSGS